MNNNYRVWISDVKNALLKSNGKTIPELEGDGYPTSKTIRDIKRDIESIPSAEGFAAGWIVKETAEGKEFYICSKCMHKLYETVNPETGEKARFCPHCGTECGNNIITKRERK